MSATNLAKLINISLVNHKKVYTKPKWSSILLLIYSVISIYRYYNYREKPDRSIASLLLLGWVSGV